MLDKWAKDEETALTRMQGILARQDNELVTVKKEIATERGRVSRLADRLARCETWIRMQPSYPKWVDDPVELPTDTDIHKALAEGGPADGT
jgi:hypothetical protein